MTSCSGSTNMAWPCSWCSFGGVQKGEIQFSLPMGIWIPFIFTLHALHRQTNHTKQQSYGIAGPSGEKEWMAKRCSKQVHHRNNLLAVNENMIISRWKTVLFSYYIICGQSRCYDLCICYITPPTVFVMHTDCMWRWN